MSNLANPSSKHWMHIEHFKSIENGCPSGQPMEGMASFYWTRLKPSFGMDSDGMQAAGPSGVHVQ